MQLKKSNGAQRGLNAGKELPTPTEWAALEKITHLSSSNPAIHKMYGKFAGKMKKLVDFDRLNVLA